MGQMGFFDLSDKLSALSELGDPLEKLNQTVDWSIFQPVLARTFRKERKSLAGRPAYEYLLMFKVLILQSMYNLSDAQTQYQILDRLSFRRFLGASTEQAPDEKTIWLFRETLAQRGAIEKLFNLFDRHLTQAGYQARKGQIVDASFVEAPRQRNRKEENERILKGETPEGWEEKPAKLCQKDTDARWTKKNGAKYFGYKNHVNIDVKHKLIRQYAVTPANVHDSQVLDQLRDQDNTYQAMWGDSAYSSENIRKELKRKGIIDKINRKGYRNRPLSKFQVLLNRKKSKIRARVEHAFGRLDFMIGRWIRCIGEVRAAARIGLMNLTYNLHRYEYLTSRA